LVHGSSWVGLDFLQEALNMRRQIVSTLLFFSSLLALAHSSYAGVLHTHCDIK
jgi:hypothetical protein